MFPMAPYLSILYPTFHSKIVRLTRNDLGNQKILKNKQGGLFVVANQRPLEGNALTNQL
jgi:hypothetical protein